MMIFAALVAPLMAFACPDFSGSFINEAGEFPIELRFAQAGCESAQMEIMEGEYGSTLAMIFDGKLRPTYQTPTELFEQSAVWEGEKIRFVEEYFWKTSNARMRIVGTYSLDDRGNFVEEKDAFDGQGRFEGHYVSHFRRQ